MADVTEDQLSHRVKQLAVFLPNRLGALLGLNRTLEAADIKVRAISILDAADHAVVRLVVDQPTLAAEILKTEGYGPVEAEVLGVALPPGASIRKLLTSVIAAELNIHYLYSLMAPVGGRNVLALRVENADAAAKNLLAHGMQLISQDDLK
jgi:hypothetical protein